MNKNFLLFTLSSCIFFIVRSSAPMPTSTQNFGYPQPMVQVIVPNSNTSSSQALNSSASQSLNNNLNKINLTHIQKNTIDIKNKILNSIKQVSITKLLSSWQQQIKVCGNDATKRILGFFEQLGQLMYNHKFKIIAVGIGMTYGYIFFTAHNTNRYLQSDCLWSSWKSEFTLEQLLAVPQNELAQELLADIQAHYVNADEPTNFLSPLAEFIQETDAELMKLKRCASFASWMFRLKLSKLLPFTLQKEEAAQKRIERLTYLKTIFSSWIAQYKLTRNL